jgi:polar amino acid transport system substrate-binding protein
MRIARTLIGALLGLVAMGVAAQADVLDDIKKRGTLVVGVKADYKPFGFRDPSGGIIGIEPDLAADVAKKLGVKLELVPVVSANRMEFLNQGKIDLMIATMSDTPERRKIVQVIEPLYYSDAVNVLLKKDAPVKSWEDLKGKKLCGTTGAFYNKQIAQKYEPEIASFDGSEKPLLALKNGDCIGYLYDQTFIAGKLLDKEWMKSGRIVELEKKWSVPPTDYAKRMHEKFKSGS